MPNQRQTALLAAMNTAPVTPKGDAAKDANATELFGSKVFGLDEMHKRLPKAVYTELLKTIEDRKSLNPQLADVIAKAMKDWAMEHGATHYTHWFQPMTGLTAEKHDAFLSPSTQGHAISEFSGKMLISGEPDASSFPSGGLRSTFEARGYTAWDPTVPAFLIQQPYGATLHIPSYFYSYAGEALDRKIPLERSLEALSREALRILRLFGQNTVKSVTAMVGPEQEYFLVDKNLAALRPDLLLTGRTLLGAPAPKGQELADHYFGAIPERVLSFMQDLERELLALGIPCKTRHNEVAPGQFELAPVYEDANSACDHNMLTMNMMRHLAPRHGFICLLHEKPFAGVNGSGKHNNWSLCTDAGQNLLNPGQTPTANAQFLVFLAAVLAAVHKHSTALRLGTIGCGNDHRLGANEAPPAIISVYLGEQLTLVIEQLMNAKQENSSARKAIEIGVSTLPPLPVDQSDRNRTSPFAFTGNKFEFRAVGSSQSVAPANIALNAAVACTLREIADKLEEEIKKGQSLQSALQELLPRLFKEHWPVVFNGNGYDQAWLNEAKERGLPNYDNTVEALAHYTDPEVMEVFLKSGILTEREIKARQEILFENYAKSVLIEGRTIQDLVQTKVLPPSRKALENAAISLKLCDEVRHKHVQGEEEYLENLAKNLDVLHQGLKGLTFALKSTEEQTNPKQQAQSARDLVLPAMAKIRSASDALELLLDDELWQLPRYAELLWIH
ncbi:MAG: glutamine synthetase III [Desulfovibrio sp.]|nr:glutamine synthetase III [Desulfovibrio sp.]